MSEPIKVNELSESTKASMKSRIIVALVMVVLGVPCVFIGSWAIFVLAMFIGGVGTHEILNSTKKKVSWPLILTQYFLFASITLWPLIKGLVKMEHFAIEACYIAPSLPIGTVAIGICLTFLLGIMSKTYDILDLCYLFVMTIALSMGIQSFLIMRFLPYAAFSTSFASADVGFNFFFSVSLVVFVLASGIFNDIFAYFTGVLFGKHKMCPSISPKKTWEGFVGGWIGGAVLPMAFAFILSAAGHPILPNLDWYWIVIISLILPLVAVVGDLAFSLVKRHYGKKDFGTILKSHGGILDRVDSLVFLLLFASFLMTVVQEISTLL